MVRLPRFVRLEAIPNDTGRIFSERRRKSRNCVCLIAVVLCVFWPLFPAAQTTSKSGANAAPANTHKTAVTEDSFVDAGPVVFQDVAKAAGLSGWKPKMGAADKGLICDVNGSGVGLIDYDNDGWLDIYLVNGSNFAALDGKQEPPHAALLHNNHDGTFTDVAAKAGVTNDRWGFGVAIADYDNDGWPDIYVSNFGKNRLYHNNHNGTFTDVAEKANVTLGNWSTGSTWGDYDGDGRLDLFVAGDLHWDWNNPPPKGGE